MSDVGDAGSAGVSAADGTDHAEFVDGSAVPMDGRFVVHRVDSDGRMRSGRAGSHFSSNPDRFHNLLAGSALQHRSFGVAADAPRTLGGMRHGNRAQVFGF